mmetsp:Transcript_27121/g.51024  ORF Transcript_27121/g.51024 Transcript_27121/m.51024 type:complete len:214 (+) Transcript_27121:61-702(+)
MAEEVKPSNASSGTPLGSVRSSSYSSASGNKPCYRELKHYMSSSCRNPYASAPHRWDAPHNVAQSTVRHENGFTSKKRPVNKRNYVSPNHWVQTVERGDTNQNTTYLDYAFTDEFARIWREAIKKEASFQGGSLHRMTKATRQTRTGTAPEGAKRSNGSLFFSTEYSTGCGFGQTVQQRPTLVRMPDPTPEPVSGWMAMPRARSAPALAKMHL